MCMAHKRSKLSTEDRLNHVVITAVAGIAGLYSLDYLLSHIGIVLIIFTIYGVAVSLMALASLWALLAQFLVK